MPTLEYTVFGKKIEHSTPVQKVLLTGLGVGVIVTVLWLSQVLVPTHVLLCRPGRNGFYDAPSKTIHVDRNSFARQDR